MHIEWSFSDKDTQAVRATIEENADSPLLQDRRARNLAETREPITSERFWRALCMGLLTTQQPSGPTSAVSRLLCAKPFPLAHVPLANSPDPATSATAALVAYGGIRRHGSIGREIGENLRVLEGDEWSRLLEALSLLSSPADAKIERRVADYLNKTFLGLGPKQARNVLQALGLTRHEIPLDSRVAKWLRKQAFPVPVSAAALSDREYYCFVLDGVQRLCSAAGVFPCELDGAIFASYDKESWNPDLVRF